MIAAMVISEWHVSGEPNSKGEFVSIRARDPGLISWALSLMTVDRGIQMVVTGHHIQFKKGDLSGTQTRIIPLGGICSTEFGYSKPLVESISISLTIGMIIWVTGSMGAAGFVIGLLAGGGIGAIYYALNNRLSIGLIEYSGHTSHIIFKRSLLENINIDEKSAARVGEIIQWLADAARQKSH